MIESRPDWVISRQRAWGVPIAVFVSEKGDGSAEILQDDRGQRAHRRRLRAGRRRRLVHGRRRASASSGTLANDDWKKVDDILDVWFDSGSTHAFVLEDPEHFPAARRHQPQGRRRRRHRDVSRRLRPASRLVPFLAAGKLRHPRPRALSTSVLTHGFTLDENGRKMSKSLGNTVAPQEVIKHSGADILRLWVCASDYADDQRIGPEILKTTIETYRKLRNTIRWMLGTLAHFQRGRARRARGHAGAGAADAAPARRARRARAQGLRRVRLQARLRRAHRPS